MKTYLFTLQYRQTSRKVRGDSKAENNFGIRLRPSQADALFYLRDILHPTKILEIVYEIRIKGLVSVEVFNMDVLICLAL